MALDEALASGIGGPGCGAPGTGLLSRRLSDPNLAGSGGVTSGGVEKGAEWGFDKTDHGGLNTERYNGLPSDLWKEDSNRFPSKETLKVSCLSSLLSNLFNIERVLPGNHLDTLSYRDADVPWWLL